MKNSGIEWIGNIPDSWSLSRLQWHLSEVKESNDPVKTTQVLSLTNKLGVIPYEEKGDHGNKAKENLNEYKLAYPGTIVANSMNILIGSVGKCDYFGCVSPVYYVFKPNDGENIDFLNYVFQTEQFQKELRRYANGILEIRLRVSANDILKRKVAFPSIEQQSRIVTFLNIKIKEIDELISIENQQIDNLIEYKRAIITEAITKGINSNVDKKESGIDWIGAIPQSWTIKKFKHLGQCRNGLTYSPSDMCDKENGTLVLRSSNIQNNSLVFDDNVYVNCDIKQDLLVKEGDILICSRNGSAKLIGKNALIPKNLVASFGAFMMIFRSCCPEYCRYILSSNIFLHYLGSFLTVSVNQLTGSNFMNIQFPFPDDENERNLIVKYLDKKCLEIDTLIDNKRKKIKNIEEYKKSLIYEYITGKKEVA